MVPDILPSQLEILSMGQTYIETYIRAACLIWVNFVC